MLNIKEFMHNHNLAILVDVDVENDMFHVHKINRELQSYDLFEQLILFGNVEDLLHSVSGQILPRIWTQGNTKCVISRLSDDKLVCVFYDTQLDAKDNYFYAKRLNDELSELFNDL